MNYAVRVDPTDQNLGVCYYGPYFTRAAARSAIKSLITAIQHKYDSEERAWVNDAGDEGGINFNEGTVYLNVEEIPDELHGTKSLSKHWNP